MSQILSSFFIWLHSMATVVFIGHFLLLALIYLPTLEKFNGSILSEISKRSRVWLYLSMGVFLVTGIYLMIVNPNYFGIGKFNNPWSILMLVKHILLLGMLGMGFWFNAILHVGPQMSTNTGAASARICFRQFSNIMAISGALVLLLTAISQS